ncbi:MAG: allantoate amidohydrolase [Chitinophagaceae bacterium]
MDKYTERTEKILARINELAGYSEDKHALTRTFGSPAFVEASGKVVSWMKEAGLQTSIDNIGNIRGRFMADSQPSKTFIIASHIDSVVNAGKFDGPLGVVMGLDLVANLITQQSSIPFNIELIAFSDEEGVRFHSTFLGSKVIAGTFEKDLLLKKDTSGIFLQEVIRAIGSNPDRLSEDAIPSSELLGYFEIHIEQGPVLYEKNIPAAIVTGIAGQRRIELIFKGIAGHAGTVPMDMRSDALCAAAACILEIEKLAMAQKDKVVATVGKLDIRNAASNVIPGDVVCSLDLRSVDETILEAASKDLQKIGEEVCRKRSVDFKWNLIQATKPVACDTRFNYLLQEAIEEAGYKTIRLVSGAGHDAVAIAGIAPVCMLFVRCFKGISHNPLEDVEPGDIKASLKIAEKFIHKLITQY